MTVCLVHGNPETAAVWDRLAPLLDRGPVVRLSPPGFGAPVPPGFTATVEEYRRWLVAELEFFDQPVHLMGHDWGGAHVVNVAMTRPELMRSWVCTSSACSTRITGGTIAGRCGRPREPARRR